MSGENAISLQDRILGGIWGSLIGDALGVPVEFKSRATVRECPVVGMRGYGTHYQPPGTWSDDGALILCTVDSLVNCEFDTTDMGSRFVRWMNEGLWTANGVVFDIGTATASALTRISNGTQAEHAGGKEEYDNGNGSLMRILPVTMRFASESVERFAALVERASSLTHAHARSQMACVFLGLFVRQLLRGRKPQPALDVARMEFRGCYNERTPEFEHFRRLFDHNLSTLPESKINSTGYVLDTLHASLWCLLTTDNFSDCVLKAVNLGEDTDTTGCLAGSLSGVTFGIQYIKPQWLDQIARKEDVNLLAHKFALLCEAKNDRSNRMFGNELELISDLPYGLQTNPET